MRLFGFGLFAAVIKLNIILFVYGSQGTHLKEAFGVFYNPNVEGVLVTAAPCPCAYLFVSIWKLAIHAAALHSCGCAPICFVTNVELCL
jgi:hypothetical protein